MMERKSDIEREKNVIMQESWEEKDKKENKKLKWLGTKGLEKERDLKSECQKHM